MEAMAVVASQGNAYVRFWRVDAVDHLAEVLLAGATHPMSELASQLLPRLYESWLKAALEAQAHVEANWGPSIVEVKFSRRDPQQPVTWGLKLLKEWREKGA